MKNKAFKRSDKKTLHFMGIGEIKAMKDGGVVIEGLANKNVVDRGKDLIATDAWDLENYKKNPVILFNHGFDPQLGSTPVGKAIEIKPTENGLYIKAQLASIDDPLINRIRGLVEERILRAFSVGFNPIESDTDSASGVKTIKKAELFEVSIVGVPMNQDSLFEVSGKMLKSAKSMDDLRHSILVQKGCMVAAAIHTQLHNLQADEGLDRSDALAEVMSKAGIDESAMMDILAGNTVPVPPEALTAFSEVLKMDAEALVKMDAEDKALYDKVEAEEVDDEAFEAEDEEESTSEGEEGVEEGSQTETSGEVGSGKKKPSKTDEGADKADAKEDDFQKCVSDKIGKLIAEGKEQDQAVAIAISMCQEGKSEKVKLTKAQYTKLFEFADSVVASKKQADQGEDVQPATSTINAAKTEGENNEFGSPQMDLMKQTNVLLGALINEIQKMSAKLDGLTPQEMGAKPVDETPPPKKEEEKSSVPEDEMTDEEAEEAKKLREKQFGLASIKGLGLRFEKGKARDLKAYADPVNLMYPCDSAEGCLASIASLKKDASSHPCATSVGVIHSRLVESALALGAEVDYDEEDSLDAALPTEVKSSLREINAKMLDSYVKRLENVKKKLKEVETKVKL